jgi:rhodanese-related sulfurtransferase
LIGLSSFRLPFFSNQASSPNNTPSADTREPGELALTGKIPGALNIPVSSSPDAFFLSADAFEDKFGFARPDKDKEVVFYCKAGVRSRAAAQLARQAGWEHVAEYGGSWLDWEVRGGEKEKA